MRVMMEIGMTGGKFEVPTGGKKSLHWCSCTGEAVTARWWVVAGMGVRVETVSDFPTFASGDGVCERRLVLRGRESGGGWKRWEKREEVEDWDGGLEPVG